METHLGLMKIFLLTSISLLWTYYEGTLNREEKTLEFTETIVDISEKESITLSDEYCCWISWTPPNNLELTGSQYWSRNSYIWYEEISIYKIGFINGINDINFIPETDYSIPANGYRKDSSITCEPGCGYVIKLTNCIEGKTIYARMYIMESILNSNGKIAGAKLIYQCPFEP